MTADDIPEHALAARINQSLMDLWLRTEQHGPRYDDFALAAQQHVVLGEIVADPDVTPKQLAETLGISKGAVSQHLTRLERDHYISRQRSPHDGRVRVFQLEPRGTAYQRAVHHYEQHLAGTYIAKLSLTDMQEINTALTKLKQVFEK
ncbi:MarR family winged helix-turn-helix transcriptional regulator [Streptomyces kronopolitis]